MQHSILIVDDDQQLTSFLGRFFAKHGYQATTVGTAAQTFAALENGAFDLVILDLILPDEDGLEVAKTLRKTTGIPIIMLTARDDIYDRIVGLELGADDYVTKPFSPRELVARIRTILKRSQKAQASTSLTHGELSLDPRAHRCQINRQEIALTAREQGILALLLQDPARIRSRAELISQIWGAGSQVSDRTLDSHLRNLRAKLEQAGGNDLIETVHAVGIRLRGLS